ncbi:MAG: eL32 family ribosomal protein [Candidatus Nanoarchaeia archaeon]|nr:eL32 family ribosomal protein [Candidatus Nanoarchaeia archaeon]
MSLLEKKRVEKKKMPKFIRSDAHKKKRLGIKWKKPIGIHPKMRLKIKGKPVMVNIGYKTPLELQNHSMRNGLKIVEVRTMDELKLINPKEECAELVGVGFRKKKEMIAFCEANKITINNLRNPKQFVERKENELKAQKEKTTKRSQMKKEKTKKDEKVVEKKSLPKKEEPELSADEEKKQKKKEIDKVLISKQ